MTRNTITILICGLLTISSCSRYYSIEERAHKQFNQTLVNEIKGIDTIIIQEIETIYTNDSICLLQANVEVTDTIGNIYNKELRYIYYIDLMQSRIFKKLIFCEEMTEVPRMPIRLIKKCRKDVRKNKENVYNSMIGRGYRILNNFDD